MKRALQALLTQVIDYAGLYPPASLELDAAVREYAGLAAGRDAWMLARFLCGAPKLKELAPLVLELFGAERPLEVVIVGRGGANRAEFTAGAQQDAAEGATFEQQTVGRARVVGYELRFPLEAVRAGDRLGFQAAIEFAFEAWQGGRDTNLPMFFEAGHGGDWRRSLTAAIEAVAAARELGRPAGFKLRTGGLEPAAFPSPEQVAFVIKTCQDCGVPQKYTAGLHHPVRLFDSGVRCAMHGFLNVLLATVLAHTHMLDLHDLQAILEEQDIRQFQFADELLGWSEADAVEREIRHVRAHFLKGFGSCSFEEPRADLMRAGLWT